MIKQTPEEIVDRLKDFDVLDILREMALMEIILFLRAREEGQNIKSEDSSYFLFFGDILIEFGPKKLIAVIKKITPDQGRHLLAKFLEFNFFLAQAQIENPDRDIYCASINIREVLRAGMGVVSE
jgi:hypothetical protein